MAINLVQVEWFSEEGAFYSLFGKILDYPEVGKRLVVATKQGKHTAEIDFGEILEFDNLSNEYNVLTNSQCCTVRIIQQVRKLPEGVVDLAEVKFRKRIEKIKSQLSKWN